MLSKFSRRKRLIIITTSIGFVFLAVVSLTIWLLAERKPYRPGEKIEGVVADLARRLPANYPKVTFVDAGKEAGIDFRHFSGQRSTQLPEDMGSGAAWGDYDNDGWPDLFIVNQAGPLTMSEEEMAKSPAHCELYHNNRDGTFTEVSVDAGVDFRGWGMAAAWGDANNDGWPDLFVTSFGKNLFYHNNGDGTFRDMTTETGLEVEKGFWAGASWADFNGDGFLDLYVCGYVKYEKPQSSANSKQYDVEVPASINPSAFEPERNFLYRNNGDGTFSDIAVQAGVAGFNGKSLNAAWCDFDHDGLPDLYVANDVSDNVFMHNLGDEVFEEISLKAMVADYRGAMGLGLGDWDQDADMDIFVTHWIAQENALYTNKSAEFSRGTSTAGKVIRFMDEADRYGLGQIALDYIGWGTSFFDYDNDGRLDLFVANGSTFQQKENTRLLIPMTDLLFWNSGVDKGFYDLSAVSGEVFGYEYVGRGAAFADYDNDGDVDIFVVNNDGPGLLLKNEGGNKNNWLKVHVIGSRSNRQAVGAKLRLVSDASVQIRQVGAQCSYLSQNSLIEHFGLGSDSRIDTLEVTWPSGLKQTFVNLTVEQTFIISEGEDLQRRR